MINENELYLKIDDDFKSIQFFDASVDYPKAYDDFTNEVHISISNKAETIAYLECRMFYDVRIAESIYDYAYIADEMVQDVYEAMELLQECSLVPPTDKNRTLGELLSCYPTVTVYLHQIAVKDSYRKNGIGGWLVRNLPRILERNYSVFPRVIITLISPQKINWNAPSEIPLFDDLDKKSDAYQAMLPIMKRLFNKNGYKRQKNTDYYIAK